MKKRSEAIQWFNHMNLEDQFYTVIEHNDIISGDTSRHPSTLSGSEIEKIYIQINK